MSQTEIFVILGILGFTSLLWFLLRPLRFNNWFKWIYGTLLSAALVIGLVLSFKTERQMWSRVVGFVLIAGPVCYLLVDSITKERTRKHNVASNSKADKTTFE
jgi:hypothetical protein